MKILIVEDEVSIVEDITSALIAANYTVEVAREGKQALERGLFDEFEAIILDLGLPDMDGIDLLKQWRQENVMTPILVLTARSDWLDRVEGINQGADDYLTKPVRIEELIARLRAIIRRSKGQASPIITSGPYQLKPNEQSLFHEGERVDLSPLEFRVVSNLMYNKGKTISSYDLIEKVYGLNSDRDHNSLEALIGRTRKKLQTPLIHTRRGFGYVIEEG